MLKIILSLCIGYLIGSIPWALIIGKVFYDTDIREKGSGNLGGTNAGRVLGKKVGLTVIVLDALKAFIVMTLCHFFIEEATVYAGLAVCIGHCFPVFANFKGGKAVACSMGYVLGLALYITHNIVLTLLIPLSVFLIVLFIFKYVSLASICGLWAAAIMGLLTYNDLKLASLVCILAAFVTFMHQANIKRLINGNESKIKWLDRK